MEEQQVCGLIGASIYIWDKSNDSWMNLELWGPGLPCSVSPDSDMWRKEHENCYVETSFLTISTTHSASAAQTVQ